MEYSDRGFEAVIAYIYEYFSEFKLLITGAPGNYYQEFLEGLVQLDTDCTKKFLIQVGSKSPGGRTSYRWILTRCFQCFLFWYI